LTAGTYVIRCEVPAYGVDRHQARLYQTSGTAAAVAYGSSANCASSLTTISIIHYTVVLTTTTTYRVDHRTNSSGSSSTVGSAMGTPCSFANTEVYTQVMIQKIA